VERAFERGLKNVILPLETAELYLSPSQMALEARRNRSSSSAQKLIGTKHVLVLTCCGTSSAP